MWLHGATVSMLLAAVSVVVLALAACAPADEPMAEPGGEDRNADSVAGDEPAQPEGGGDAADPESEAPPGEGEEVTAYVVAYHWGFALFDEDGGELEQLEVARGATVELVAVNDHASEAIEQLPGPVAEAIEAVDWHERAHEVMAEGRIPDPKEETGMGLSEAINAAHAETADHGLMVQGSGERTVLSAHADEPVRLSFPAEKEGRFEFRCTEECGYGHEHQRWKMLVVA